jgi:hypothetical protein
MAYQWGKTFGLPFALAMASTGTTAHATIYDLGADWSDISNPNGVWSFTYGSLPSTSGLLSHQTALNNGNHLYPAVANGMWGAGPDLNTNTPEIFKAAVDGSSAGLTNSDFLTGDIVLHSPNSFGDSIFVNWTAPTAGSISIGGGVWYAHSSVDRAFDSTIYLNSSVQSSATINSTFNRDNQLVFGGSTTLQAGDVISIGFAKSAGQQFGSLSGLRFTVDFMPSVTPPAVPEASTWAMMIAGFGAVGFAMRRRRSATVRFA